VCAGLRRCNGGPRILLRTACVTSEAGHGRRALPVVQRRDGRDHRGPVLGTVWRPADERYRQRPAENLADKRLTALAPDDSLTGLEGVPVNGRLSVPGKAIVFVAIAGANNSASR